MAVGKGSMARASKAAAAKSNERKEDTVLNVEAQKAGINEKNGQDEGTQKPVLAAKASKKATKKSTVKKAEMMEETKVTTGSVIEATSEQVLKQIVYQKSSQVLDREAEKNETFGVGEAMPIYFY